MEWWAIWLLFFGIFFGCGRMCGWGSHRREERLERMRDRRDRRRDQRLNRRRGKNGVFIGAAVFRDDDEEPEPERALAEKPRRRGSQLERLQSDFVAGRITMDEYERRLDSIEHL